MKRDGIQMIDQKIIKILILGQKYISAKIGITAKDSPLNEVN